MKLQFLFNTDTHLGLMQIIKKTFIWKKIHRRSFFFLWTRQYKIRGMFEIKLLKWLILGVYDCLMVYALLWWASKLLENKLSSNDKDQDSSNRLNNWNQEVLLMKWSTEVRARRGLSRHFDVATSVLICGFWCLRSLGTSKKRPFFLIMVCQH